MAKHYQNMKGKNMALNNHPDLKNATVDDPEDMAEMKATGKAPSKVEEAREDANVPKPK